MVLGDSSEGAWISTSPDLTTKNLKSRSPTSKSARPAGYRSSEAPAQRRSSAIWTSSSVGKAATCKQGLLTAQPRAKSVTRDEESSGSSRVARPPAFRPRTTHLEGRGRERTATRHRLPLRRRHDG